MSKTNEFSEEQKTQLSKCESAITKGTKGFFEMCKAFRIIDKDELWKGSHESFQKYLKDKWHMDDSKVSHYIKAAEVLDDLKKSEKLPTNEGQCRVLGRLTPDQRRQVWAKVLESDEKPTGSLIEKTAKELGFLTKPDEEEQGEAAPPKEDTFLSNFAMTVNSLTHLRNSVEQIEVSETEQVREYIVQCRSELERIEKAIAA